jgi:hypothetical protein
MTSPEDIQIRAKARCEYCIIGRTDIGRVTVRALQLNHPQRLRIREAEQTFGLFPPDDVR